MAKKITNQLLIIFFTFLLYSCFLMEHDAVGTWKAEKMGFDISFYPDGTGKYLWTKTTWTKIDRKTVKFEVVENNHTFIVEFSIAKDEKGLLGILHNVIGETKYRKIR